MRTGVIAKPVKSLLALVLAGLFASASNAAIFEDGEARRAILELRQRVDSMQAAQQKAADEHRQDTEQLRRILLDLLLGRPCNVFPFVKAAMDCWIFSSFS